MQDITNKAVNQTVERLSEMVADRLADLISKKLEQPGIKRMLYTAEEAAQALGISLVFLRQLVRQKEIAPIVRLGKRGIRIPVSALEDFVARGGVSKVD